MIIAVKLLKINEDGHHDLFLSSLISDSHIFNISPLIANLHKFPGVPVN